MEKIIDKLAMYTIFDSFNENEEGFEQKAIKKQFQKRIESFKLSEETLDIKKISLAKSKNSCGC